MLTEVFDHDTILEAIQFCLASKLDKSIFNYENIPEAMFFYKKL